MQNQTSAIVSVFTIIAAESECLQLGQAIPITTFPPPSSDSYDPTELISLSNDGHVLAVVNPLDANGVQVYEKIYNASAQLEYAARGDVITIANSTAVSLSDDRIVLAIGVPFCDLGNGQFGSTLVYEWPFQTISGGPTLLPTPVSSNNCKQMKNILCISDFSRSSGSNVDIDCKFKYLPLSYLFGLLFLLLLDP